ncbi:cobalamin B12-binding domain-containing protein [Actinomycetospora aeridis]|uniref:Cobalamin-dependent protein n=1 Tax=Actinomycetospora aeridis TaxID=3129231 RepID=A0ABU8NAI1_9PSEU
MTTASPPSTDPGALRAAYLERLADADEPGAVAVALDALDAGADPETVLLDVVAGAQREIGDLWASGEWTVVQEHVATHISERVVAAVARRAPARPPAGLGTVAVACLDGEWHGLPARLLAEVLARHGWSVEFLGASVPAAQLASHVHRVGPDVVAISSSLPSRLPAARRMVEACRATGTPVLAGGAAFGEDGRWARAVGADGWAPDARAAAAMLAADPDGPWFADRTDEDATPGSSADRSAREEQAVLHARRGELVHLAAASARTGIEETPEDLADDLGHLVDFLAAAVFVDDPSLFDGFVRWVGTVSIPEGLRTDEVAPALDALAAALADSPRTVRLLRDARSALGIGGGPSTPAG